MKFSIAAIVGVLAAVGLAKPSFNNLEFDVKEGIPFTLTWRDAVGPVTLTLVEGPTANTMVPVRDIASGVTTTSFTFTPRGLPSGRYAFRINDSDPDPNFSEAFQYVGTGPVSSASTASSTTSRVTSSSESSASSTASISSTAASNRSTTTAATTTSRTTQTTVPTGNINGGERFSSPLALVLLTVAALAFFN